MSGAGTLLLIETAWALRPVDVLQVELGGFMRSNAVLHLRKAVCDPAVMLAAGGECPADVAMLRARPYPFGMVASKPTVSRIIDDLAGNAPTGIAGNASSHSENERAAPNDKRGFGFHPILAFADHGAGGTGTPQAAILRPGNAGSNTATDQLDVTALGGPSSTPASGNLATRVPRAPEGGDRRRRGGRKGPDD